MSIKNSNIRYTSELWEHKVTEKEFTVGVAAASKSVCHTPSISTR